MRKQRVLAVGASLLGTALVVVAVAPLAISDDTDPKATASASLVDPAENLPDAEREAAYLAQLTAATTARNEWVLQFEEQGRSVVGLESLELNVESVPAQPTLPAALRAAALAVDATVVDLTFAPEATVATLRVSRVLKGDPALATVRTVVGGGPEPGRTGAGVLGIDPSMPFLHQGTRAVLLLNAEGAGSSMPAAYAVQPYTGTYLVDAAGKVRPHEGNPFGARLDGMDVTAFADLVVRTLNG